ncbi:MAG TPA: FG-GAP-like repeat-containing protein, partial [Pyrinomonadaceae bacterium]|nr:FG-GAP-like repeat-containing protein [Pyrinomonadaceae bacterium]
MRRPPTADSRHLMVIRVLLVLLTVSFASVPALINSFAASTDKQSSVPHILTTSGLRSEDRSTHQLETSNLFGSPNTTDINQNQDHLTTDAFAVFYRPSGAPAAIRLYQSGEPVPGNPNSRGDIITGGIRLNNSGVAMFAVDYPQSDGVFQKSILRYNGTLQSVLHSFDIAPNSGGAPFGRNFTLGGQNDNGEIALVAPLVASNSTAPAQNTIFVIASNGSVTRITGQGDAAPGTGGGTFSNITVANGVNSITAAGEVIFSAQITGGVGGFGLFAASSGSVRKIIANGDANPLGGNFSITSAIPTVRCSVSGVVAFNIGTVLWKHSTGGGLQKAAAVGDATPVGIGGTYSALPTLVAIADSGIIVFTANVTGGITPRGIFRVQSNNTVDTVVYANEAAPGAGAAVFALFSVTTVNTTGTVSFGASLTGGATPRGLFQQTSGNPTKVVLEGETSPLPGGGTFLLNSVFFTRTLANGKTYFSCNIIGTGADYAEFVGTAGSFTTVYDNSESLPAGSRTVLRTFHVTGSGDYVGFIARQAGGRSSLMVRNVSTNVTTTAMTDGDTAPGTGGGRYRNAIVNTVYPNSNGTVAFTGAIIGGTVVTGTGLWVSTTAGVVSKVVSDGDIDINTGQSFSTISVNALGPSPINNLGQVVFRATVGGIVGVYVGAAGVPAVRIIRVGDTAPGGGTISNPSVNPSINGNGQVAIFATTTGGPGQNQGIFIGSPGNALARVAVSGDATPSGGTFFAFPTSVSLNDSGEVAMIASVSPAGATSGIFAGTAGALQTIATSGAAAPSGGQFAFVGLTPDVLINNQHDIAFRSPLTGGSADSGYFLRRGAGGALQTMLTQGQPAPGAASNFSTVQGGVNNFLAEFFALGPTGEVGIQTGIQTGIGNVFGQFRYRTDNLLEKLVLRGEPLPGSPGIIVAAAGQGIGSGGPGHFSIWMELFGGNNDDLIYTTNSPLGSGITGQVRDVNGVGITGITVSLNGSVSGSTTTDASGNYSFANLTDGGNYIVTPASSSLAFSPVNQTFNNMTTNRIANFVGTQTAVAITGKISDTNNVGINGVTVALTQNGAPAGTTTTNASGNYSFNNLATGPTYVVIPVGSFAPSSQTLTNLAANAMVNFTSTPSIPAQCNTASFSSATAIPVTGQPFSVAAGDFNRDGKVDLATANFNTNNVSILIGNGTGGFGSATSFPAGTQPYSVAMADLNQDSKLDLVVANQSSSNVSVLLGDGAGGFGLATNFSVGLGPRFVAIRDLNNDGKLDVITVNRLANSLSVLLGDGLGSFALFTTVAVGTSPEMLALGDLNSDGILDAVVAIPGSLNSQVLLGLGTGGFSAPTNLTLTAGGAISVGLNDLNGDGKLDAVIPSGATNAAILIGNGAGGFSAPTNVLVGASPFSIAFGDFNGDGKIDPVTANIGSDNISVLLGTGAGTVVPQTTFATGALPRSLVVSDFNSDGFLDIAVGSQTSSNVSVLLNNGSSCNTQTSASISGRVANAANSALPDVVVTLSGPITRVTQTDALGNYTFLNLIPGGNYTVTLQSSYFVFAPSRADFFNLSSSQVANFIAAPLAVPSPTPTPNDDFGNTARDASKWSIGAQTSATTAFDPQVTTTQTNGQLVVQPLTQASGLHYAGYVSANSFDLRNGSARVEVAQAGTGGADTIFAVGTDADNFYRFMVHTPGPGTTLAPRARGRDGIERPLDATTAQLVFQVNVGGQLTSLSINYDPVQHRFMRFRHVPAMNSIVFETSPDNVDFIVQHTVVLQKSVSALTAELSAGTSNPANPGATVFDNFGLVTCTFQFSAASYAIGEGDGSILVTVTRNGSLSDAATVDFATADGTARQKTKYTNSAGTLSFASGVSSRTFRVLLVDNQLAEGDQSLNLLLSNPIGGGLNTPGRAVLTISDNDTTLATGNPMDDARYFTTQHYYDFLNRVPDQSGLDFWTGQITQCGTDVQCLRTQRITVSNAFFYEQEYQQTGSYVVRVYRAAYGNNQPIPNNDNNPSFPNENKKLVNYSVFSTDRARVRGGPSLAQTQLDLA